MKHNLEVHFLNIASRENSKEVLTEKNKLIKGYTLLAQRHSINVYTKAVKSLDLKVSSEKAVKVLSLYLNAVINQYMAMYNSNPDAFFAKQEEIKIEIKSSLDMLLYGICEEEQV